MKNTKIFVDCHVFDGNFQGTTTYLKGLYTELIQQKEITFYLASCNIDKLKAVFGVHQNVVYLKYSTKNKFIRLFFTIPQLIKKHKIDYAHFQYIVPPIKKCKYIVTIHDILFLDYPQYFPLLYRIKNKFLFYRSAKLSDIILTVSEFSKKRIEHHFKIDNITITPNAVDPIFFESYNKKEVIEIAKHKFGIENYFLFVSRWEPRKNHILLLKVFVENKYYTNKMLVFVGNKAIEDKNYNLYYSSLPSDIKNKIVCLQNINFDDLLLIVRAAEMSVYPSIAEGFGIPPLESLAANIPTICSNTTAMSDFDFLNDNLFNPFDQTDLNIKINKTRNEVHQPEIKNKINLKYNWLLSSERLLKRIIT